MKHNSYAPNNIIKLFPLVKSTLLKFDTAPNKPNIKAVINPA